MENDTELPSVFHELAATDFPFTVKFISLETDELLDELVVEEPGVLRIKGYGPDKVRVEIHWPDGEVDK